MMAETRTVWCQGLSFRITKN